MDQKQVRIVEFVCGANTGRSPIAELIGRSHLEDLGIVGYQTTSSGTLVEEAELYEKGKEFPKEWVEYFIAQGVNRGLVDVIEGSYVEQQRIAHKLFGIFQNEELSYREEAKRCFSLRGKIKTVREQIKPRSDTIAVLGMKNENVIIINELYNGFHNIPVISTLKGFAFGVYGAEFQSAYGKDLQAYLGMVEDIRDYTRKSIDKLVK